MTKSLDFLLRQNRNDDNNHNFFQLFPMFSNNQEVTGGKSFGISKAPYNLAGGADVVVITVTFINAPKFVCLL